MVCYRWFLCIFFALILSISSITAKTHDRDDVVVLDTIVVNPSGEGHFGTIQAAIDSIPSNNMRWTRVKISEGVYREKVRIPLDKPYIYLKGEGTGKTVVEWGDHGSIDTSATFTAEADHTIVRGIRFINSYNSPPEENCNPRERAVAALIRGDKSVFYNCGFLGLQDTLWDLGGRHYFKGCTIEGAVDFIFGDGQSLYERCAISVAAGALNGTPGYITAQGRVDPEGASGFVFKECRIIGTGKAYLGRPWRPCARVIYYSTTMSDVVVPQGWDAWKSAGNESWLTMSEYNSQGAGARMWERVKWAKNNLSEEEVKQYGSISFIDSEGWVDEASTIFNT